MGKPHSFAVNFGKTRSMFKTIFLKRLFLLATGLLVGLATFAQKGTIRGKVIDDATGEELIGVTVLVKGTSLGAITDFEGTFDIKIEPSRYSGFLCFV